LAETEDSPCGWTPGERLLVLSDEAQEVLPFRTVSGHLPWDGGTIGISSASPARTMNAAVHGRERRRGDKFRASGRIVPAQDLCKESFL
jgi:hypothetical protein